MRNHDRILAFDLELTDDFLDRVAERVVRLLGVERQQQHQPERWLTTQEAADYLGVPISRVYRANSQRRSAKRPIPVHHDGQRAFYKASELDDWRRQGGKG